MVKSFFTGLTVFGVTAALHANPLTWNGGDPSGNWQDGAGGWLDGATPSTWDNAGLYDANFTGTGPTTIDVHANGVVANGLHFSGSSAYELRTGGITLGNGILHAEVGAVHNIRSSLISANGLTKTGDGIVWLRSTVATLSGPVTVEAGTLGLFHANAIGSGDILVEGGGTFNPRAPITMNNKITVDTSNGETASLTSVAWNEGPDFAGDITLIGNGLTRIWGVSSKIVSGDITSESGTGELRFMADNGRLVDVSGSLDLGTRMVAFTGAGGAIKINSTGNTWGLTDVGRAIATLGANDAFATGAGLHFSDTLGRGSMNMDGYNQSVAHLSGVAQTNSITNAKADSTSTLTVGSNNSSTTFGGFIKDGAGSVALTKTGNGTLTLSGANTYSGVTRINSGALALASGGSLENTSRIIVANGATFDLTAITAGNGSYSLNAGQTLSGAGTVTGTGGGRLIVDTDAVLAAGNSPGTLTIQHIDLELTSGSISEFSIAGFAPGEYSVVSGSNNNQVTFDGLLRLRFSAVIDGTHSIDLFTNWQSMSGDFASIEQIGAYQAQSFSFDAESGTLTFSDVEFFPIPEPGTLALMVAFGLFLLHRRSRPSPLSPQPRYTS
jgi:autotransporter-associated beta strand protein